MDLIGPIIVTQYIVLCLIGLPRSMVKRNRNNIMCASKLYTALSSHKYKIRVFRNRMHKLNVSLSDKLKMLH